MHLPSNLLNIVLQPVLAIWLAYKTGKMDDFMQLIAKGLADPNFRRRLSDNATALMAASTEGGVHIVKELLKIGARVDLKDDHGPTAYDHARMHGNVKGF